MSSGTVQAEQSSQADVAAEPTLDSIASEVLGFFEHTAGAAQAQLAGGYRPSADVFASPSFSNSAERTANLSRITSAVKGDLHQSQLEPAIARLTVIDEADRLQTIYITRTTPPGPAPAGILVASYRSPIGQLASVDVGDDRDVIVRGEPRSFEIVSRANLKPIHDGGLWDSVPTEFRRSRAGNVTIRSLRALLAPQAATPVSKDGSALLAEQLCGDWDEPNVLEGIRRGVIDKMGLRDRPTLDARQDAIFRLPLDSKLFVVGPPGSGKTTTLVKRLGTKLALEYPERGEEAAVARSAAGRDGHPGSWVFFTPTDLLKQYLKEAFAKEQVPASERLMKTWTDYRRDLARNKLSILTTPNVRGAVLREHVSILLSEADKDQAGWFDDFMAWLRQAVWAECAIQADRLVGHGSPEIARMGGSLSLMLQGSTGDILAEAVELDRATADAAPMAERIRADVDTQLERAFARHLPADPGLLTDLLAFVSGLSVADDVADSDDDEPEDEDEERPIGRRPNPRMAFEVYRKTMRAKAVALARGRPLRKTTVSAQVADWMGARVPLDAELLAVGERLLAATALRWFANLLPRFVANIPRLYRRFRRERQAEGRWYRPSGFAALDLCPAEVDLLILAVLRSGNALIANRRVAQRLEGGRFGALVAIRDLWRNQVVVDEATDFSPLQIACMLEMCDPAVGSFTACGDFNQRITNWGVRSEDAFRWAVPRLDVRRMDVTYRHSRQLVELAHAIAALNDVRSSAVLPADIATEGVSPVLAYGVSQADEIAWLAARIMEIERLTRRLPSIAVLVGSEDQVSPLATALGEALEAQNIQVSAIPQGLVVGQETAVRVFSVQHIKGLEFEAVFFTRVDELAWSEPDLFDKFLYVGATRAATYLGVTCAASTLPERLEGLSSLFGSDWSLDRPLV